MWKENTQANSKTQNEFWGKKKCDKLAFYH